MLSIKCFIFNGFQENCYLVWDDAGECVIIDPGYYNQEEQERLFSFIESNKLNIKKILLTHGHFDHIHGVKSCAEKFGVDVIMNREDIFMLKGNAMLCRRYGIRLPESDFDFEHTDHGDIIKVGSMEFETIGTPGHSPGGVCYLEKNEKIMFSGDTLFAGTIGRTDDPGGDYDLLIGNIMERLMTLDGDIAVFPGHGPKTTIADERTKNPFLMPFNEVWEDER